MELVHGRSLGSALQEGTLDPREAARIGLDVLGALEAAHAAGVLHRDVKPDNVLLGRHDRVVLTDFGIAQIEGETQLTDTGGFVGSPEYTAPERVLGRRPGPASDLWSLGVVAVHGHRGRVAVPPQQHPGHPPVRTARHPGTARRTGSAGRGHRRPAPQGPRRPAGSASGTRPAGGGCQAPGASGLDPHRGGVRAPVASGPRDLARCRSGRGRGRRRRMAAARRPVRGPAARRLDEPEGACPGRHPRRPGELPGEAPQEGRHRPELGVVHRLERSRLRHAEPGPQGRRLPARHPEQRRRPDVRRRRAVQEAGRLPAGHAERREDPSRRLGHLPGAQGRPEHGRLHHRRHPEPAAARTGALLLPHHLGRHVQARRRLSRQGRPHRARPGGGQARPSPDCASTSPETSRVEGAYRVDKRRVRAVLMGHE